MDLVADTVTRSRRALPLNCVRWRRRRVARVGRARPHEPVVVGRLPHSLLRSQRGPLRPHRSLPQCDPLTLPCPSTSPVPFVLPPHRHSPRLDNPTASPPPHRSSPLSRPPPATTARLRNVSTYSQWPPFSPSRWKVPATVSPPFVCMLCLSRCLGCFSCVEDVLLDADSLVDGGGKH